MRELKVLAIGLSLVSGGCFLGPKKVAVSLPMPAQPSLTQPAPVLTLPASVTPIETPVAEAPAPVARAEEPAPKPIVTPPADKKPTPRRPRQTVAATPPPATPETAAVVPEQPVPQLREILTPERQSQYENDFSRSIASARSALGRVARRKLTLPQRENVSRIQTFLTQAEAARRDDLGTALQLARRADLLGQDLLKSLLP